MSGQFLVSPPPLRLASSPDRRGADENHVVPVKLPSPLEHQQQQTPPPIQQPITSPTYAQSAVVMQTDLLVYPPSLAKHETVGADRDLFFDTLNKFHAALGTRFMIPTIGGKELDLHLLYVEVTSRGGLDQVTKDRKWKEVTTVFNFPPTTTSASFVLRKYYITLLHHYEQVYFFGTQGQLVPPPVPLPVYQTGGNGFSQSCKEEGEPLLKRRRRKRVTIDPVHLCGVNPGTLVGHMVTGVIDGKFDHGYLVTVIVGTEKLKGILYHMPSGSIAPQFASVPDVTFNAGFNLDPEIRQRRRRRRKDEMPTRDPDAPKPNRSGYNFFFQEQHTRLKAMYPDRDREISRMIGENWNKLTDNEKAVYQERGVVDKERYKREMAEYQERVKKQIYAENCAVGIMQNVMRVTEEPGHERCDAGNDRVSGVREVDTCPNINEDHKPELAEDDGNTSLKEVMEHEDKVPLGSPSDEGPYG